jgi:hypothetical protein
MATVANGQWFDKPEPEINLVEIGLFIGHVTVAIATNWK